MHSLVEQASVMFDWLLRSTAEAAALILLILALQFPVRRWLGGRWCYLLWLVLLTRMIMPGAPQSGVSVFNLIPEARGWDYVPGIPSISSLRPPGSTPRAAAYRDSGVSVNDAAAPGLDRVSIGLPHEILACAWLIGGAVLALCAMASNLSLWTKVKHACPVADRTVVRLLDNCRSRMGLRTGVECVLVKGLRSPALYGLRRTRLLLPEDLVKIFSLKQLRHVFLHELAHVKRHDIAIAWVAAVLQIVHWFNPLVWLAFHQMRADRELACDALVLSRMSPAEPARYGETIISLIEEYSQRIQVPGMVGIVEGKAQVARRIAMISSFRGSSHPRSVFGIALLGLLACVALTDARAREDGEDINAKIRRLDIKTATLAEVKAVLGPPERYWWEDRTFDADNLPERYFASYPSGVSVFMAELSIEGIRFEEPGYVLRGSIEVGSAMDQVIEVLGPPDRTVRFDTTSSASDAGEAEGYYYTQYDQAFRLIVSGNEVIAVDLLGSGPAPRQARLEPNSWIAADGRLVDRIDYPFVDDPEVVGNWKSVDFVAEMKQFDPKSPQWKRGELYLKGLVILPNGETFAPWWTWTKGKIMHHGAKTAADYHITKHDGQTYMFFQWKSDDYRIRHEVPRYYVLRKLSSEPGDIVEARQRYLPAKEGEKAKIGPNRRIDKNGRIVDKIDYPFVNDPELIGNWGSVDFVSKIEQFDPDAKQWKGDSLFLKGVQILPGGRTDKPAWTWTKGLILNLPNKTASRCVIKRIDGKAYMFLEWKSGDYVIRHRRPQYYVLQKE